VAVEEAAAVEEEAAVVEEAAVEEVAAVEAAAGRAGWGWWRLRLLIRLRSSVAAKTRTTSSILDVCYRLP